MISSTGHGEIITDTKNRMKRGKQITLLGVMCIFFAVVIQLWFMDYKVIQAVGINAFKGVMIAESILFFLGVFIVFKGVKMIRICQKSLNIMKGKE